MTQSGNRVHRGIAKGHGCQKADSTKLVDILDRRPLFAPRVPIRHGIFTPLWSAMAADGSNAQLCRRTRLDLATVISGGRTTWVQDEDADSPVVLGTVHKILRNKGAY